MPLTKCPRIRFDVFIIGKSAKHDRYSFANADDTLQMKLVFRAASSSFDLCADSST